MISKNRFAKLKRGDVILFNGRPRVVQEGPSDDKRVLEAIESGTVESLRGSMYCTFAIRKRSWTNRAVTVRNYHDLKNIITIPRKKLSLAEMCKAEKDHLASIGFDWVKELRREVAENERRNNVFGRKPNRAEKLSEKQLARATR